MKKWFQIARISVMTTLLLGAVMHLIRLTFGTDWLLAHALTPLTDSLFALPMMFGAFAIIAARKDFAFRNRFEKSIVIWTGVYFTASIPLHVQTWFTQSTDFFRIFPLWFSAVFLVYTTVMQWVWWNLKSIAHQPIQHTPTL
jgi:hypothetical protein